MPGNRWFVWFKVPRALPSIGPTGSLKTRTFLRAGHREGGPPRLLLLDYEDGADHYEGEFNFARVKIQQVMRLDDPKLAVTRQEVQDLSADRNVYNTFARRTWYGTKDNFLSFILGSGIRFEVNQG